MSDLLYEVKTRVRSSECRRIVMVTIVVSKSAQSKVIVSRARLR